VLDQSPDVLRDSMFMAFYSLNEADLDARQKIRAAIQGFGRILVGIHHGEDGYYGWATQEELANLHATNHVEKDTEYAAE
jgi:hypothetical protein